jgi:two-component system repressor protein LuxO
MAQAARFYGPAHHRVLVIENDFVFARHAAAALAARLINSEIEIASDLESAERRLSREVFNAVLASERIASDATQVVEGLRGRFRGPLLILTENGAGDAHSAGADAIIAKPCTPDDLVETLSEHLGGALAPLEATGDHGSLIGSSPAMRAVFEALPRIASSEAPVFIRGARGTGKTVLARLIHDRSPRAASTFVMVDCSALDEETAASAFFGQGACEARRDRGGFLERASGGTLFLDNAEALPPSFRPRLLAALRSGRTQRLGDGRSRRIDLRVLAAGTTASGDTLTDWLSVLPLDLPPLRERGEDAVLLARHVLRECTDREGRGFIGFDLFAERLIAGHDWPENLWGLKAMIQRLVVLNEGTLITADMLPPAVTHQLRPAVSAQKAPIRPLREQQDRLIEQALAAFGGNIAKAAAALQINPSTIYRRRPHRIAG